MATTAADVLIDTSRDWGVTVVFGLPGDGINGIAAVSMDRDLRDEVSRLVRSAGVLGTGARGVAVVADAKTKAYPGTLGVTATAWRLAPVRG